MKKENETISDEIKTLETSINVKNNQYYQIDSKNRWEIKLLEEKIHRETKEITERAKTISERLWNMVGFEEEKVT